MSKMNDFKRELAKLTGIDMFNPKFKDVFKRYFPEDEDAEEKRAEEFGVEAEDKVEDAPEEVLDDVKKVEDSADEKEVEDKVEDIDKAEDEREIDKIEEDKADDGEKEDEKKDEVAEESEEIGKDVDELKEDKGELLDAKIELELMHNGVRPERLESAKKFAKYEVNSLDELGKIKELLKEYPEWVRGYRPENFGMPVDENKNELTEEEKRLKAMGINPRD